MRICDLVPHVIGEPEFVIDYGVEREIVLAGKKYVWNVSMQLYEATEEAVIFSGDITLDYPGWFVYGKEVDSTESLIIPIYVGLLNSTGHKSLVVNDIARKEGYITCL